MKRLEIINKKRNECRIKQEKLLAIKLAKIENERLKKEKKSKKQGKKQRDKKKKKAKKEKGGKKDKKGKSDTTASDKEERTKAEVKSEPEPTFEVKDEEIVLSYLDFYPAEMVLWRDFQEYGVQGLFTCIIRYETDNL